MSSGRTATANGQKLDKALSSADMVFPESPDQGSELSGDSPPGRCRLLRRSLFIPRPREEVFAFFADPNNLEVITPPELGFRITRLSDFALRPGAEIHYRLRLFRVPFRWITLIPEWQPPEKFVDVQLTGPYKSWVHTHRFEEAHGGTRVTDEVLYSLPFWPLGEMAAPLVARQLRRIFDFRAGAIAKALGWASSGQQRPKRWECEYQSHSHQHNNRSQNTTGCNFPAAPAAMQ